MPFWKSSNSPSSPSPSSPSPKSTSSAGSSFSPRWGRKDFLFGRRDPGPRLTRQRKLRHLSEIEVGDLTACSAGSTPISRSPSNLDCIPSRSSSSPVLLPKPLPLPLPEQQESGPCLGVSPPTRPSEFRLPSPRGVSSKEGNAKDEMTSIVPGFGRFSHQTARRSLDAPSNGSTFSRYRKLFQDPNSVDTVEFGLSIPPKSAPASGFSSPIQSPIQSPRRLSNAEFNPSAYNAFEGLRVWSVPDIPSMDTTGFSPRTSPEKLFGSPAHTQLSSPTLKSPALRSRNPSAPPSPLHSKMFPEGSSAWHESNGNGNTNVHPLPLPPGSAAPQQSGFGYQSVAKTEVLPIANTWQKGKLIGSGTYGNVYAATNRNTGALCAMKEVNIIADDPKSAECLKQLEQEIKLLSQLKHQNIVEYYGSEMIEDRLYIFLEYVHPGSIHKYVNEHCGAMTESVVRNFTRHILQGLAYLHSTNTMHRDIKGANLLVDAHGVVKLADFGTAKHLSRAAPNLSLKGTPHWMAPEVVQATMNKDIGYDLPVDIWSLGCTIIEMFTGKHPWSGLDGTQAMFKVLHKDPHIPEALSSEGKDLLQRCFRRNPADRPTASMLLEHPFIRNSHHYHLHGSIQAFVGIKENRYSPRDRKTRSETAVKGKQVPNGDLGHNQHESSEPAVTRVSTRSTPDAVRTMSTHVNHIGLNHVGYSINVPNGVHTVDGNHHPFMLRRPHG